MSAVIAATGLAIATPGSGLDTQTVTSGATGSAVSQDRTRGFDSTYPSGSINDGTSNIYAGAAITQFYWDEGRGHPLYLLTITGAANSGWTKVTIDGTLTLTRASATFAAGNWSWSTTDTVSVQAFGNAGSVHTCVFT